MQWEESRTNFDRNLAVVIGIDHYISDGIHDLQTAVSDANAIANLLRDEYGYKDEHIVRLFSPKSEKKMLKTAKQSYSPATLEEIRKLLTQTLPNQLKPTLADRLLFYFAGHGIAHNSKDGPAGYLVPHTAEQGNPNSFLSMGELHDALSKLECHHLLIILDCCFAGTFQWAGGRKLIPILETVRREHYDRFIRYPAWQVITSAAHDQEALDVAKLAEDKRGEIVDEKQELHSPFALALLEGLREDKADIIPDGVITAHELYVYLEQQVSKFSSERQKPGIYPMQPAYDKGEFVFTKPGFTSEKLKPAPLLNESNNPYRGLASFDEKHANFFFGRKPMVEELHYRLSQPNCSLTVVLASSGFGKSSLIKAGLIPDLRYQSNLNLIKACIFTKAILTVFSQLPLKLLLIYYIQQWYILDPMRPDRFPFTALARVILPIEKPELIKQLSQINFLDEVFKPQDEKNKAPDDQSPDEMFVKLAESWNDAKPEAKLLLIEDYFDRLRALCGNPQEEEQLLQLNQEISGKIKYLSDRLQNDSQYLSSVIKKWSKTHPNTKILLTIDQLEELITMSYEEQIETHSNSQNEKLLGNHTASNQPWLPFLQVLRRAIDECPQQLHIVLTLRSDFEPRFLVSPLSSYWKDARFPVRAMNLDELREAIEGPALKQALYFEPPNLVSKLIDEVGQMPGSLALLSFTLSEIYIKLHERWTKDSATDRALQIKDYEKLGGVLGALTSRANQEYDNFVNKGEAYKATMRRVMLRMVAIDGGGVARRRALEYELDYPDPEENKCVKEVIERFVNVRLLVKGREDKTSYVEPAHDLLIQGWGLLQEWIEYKDEKENLILQSRMAAPILDWDKTKDSRFLWKQDPRIDLLDNIVKSKNSWLNKLERAFVEACVDLRDKQARERLEKDVDLKTTEAEMFFIANDRLYAIVKLIETGKLLQSNIRKGMKITEYK
ncbi:caspase family protein, partial [Nostoc sp. NIES-2111]